MAKVKKTKTDKTNKSATAVPKPPPVNDELEDDPSPSGNPDDSKNEQVQSRDKVPIKKITLRLPPRPSSPPNPSPAPSPPPKPTTREGKASKLSAKDKAAAAKAKAKAKATSRAPNVPSKLKHLLQWPADEEHVTELDMAKLGKDEHIAPISLSDRVYTQYIELLAEYSNNHVRFLRSLNPEPKLLQSMEKMIMELDNVATHPDLLDRTVLQEEIDAAGGELNYGRQSSQKFGLLYVILVNVRKGLENGMSNKLGKKFKHSGQLNMAVVVHEGNLYEILKRFLLLMNIAFTTAEDGKKHHPKEKSNLNLIVVSSTFLRHTELPSVDIIYAMDSSYDRQSPLVRSLKGDEGGSTQVLFPWICSSPEHVRACLPLVEGSLNPLRTFAEILVQASPELGKLEGTFDIPVDQRLDKAGQDLSEWILSGFEVRYPLRDLGRISLIGLKLVFKSGSKRSLVCSIIPHFYPRNEICHFSSRRDHRV